MTENDTCQYIFYTFVCNDPNVTDCYVGSTKAFRQRKAYHKRICNDDKYKSHNCKIYKMIRANGGFDNWQMIPIDVKVCNKVEARIHENILIQEKKATLNSNKAYISDEEKKAYQKEYHANYEKTHRAELNAYKNKLNALKRQREQEELVITIKEDINANMVVNLDDLCVCQSK